MNRVEIIDWTKRKRFGGGRVFTFWEANIDITYDLQDDDRTLKVFIQDTN